MKRVIISSLVSAFALFALANCTGAPESPESHHGVSEKAHLTQEKVSKIISQAAEEAGWKITEFKSNALIAEKIDGEDSISTTITFNKESFDINPENDDLEDVLNDALN